MLRQSLEHIDHKSALQILCKAEQRQKLTVPFLHLETAIALMHSKLLDKSTSPRAGIHPGDTVILTGKSGSGKTFLITRLISSHGVYINLDQHSTGSLPTTHHFRPRTDLDLLQLIYSLEKWFYDNGSVDWVMIDGDWHDNETDNDRGLKWTLIEKAKALQSTWPFALVYTSRTLVVGAHADYRFECYKQHQAVCMKLIPPFSSSHPYSANEMDTLITTIDG
ncbi:hypothetical protein [Absidia glauca]|uniref:Uncharacterized protein n=1 Tax=Absidia glauca TaxID=4829 RepID=A0A168PDY1_ABSGL|nr:hypothetical protein [Absidia glauca]